MRNHLMLFSILTVLAAFFLLLAVPPRQLDIKIENTVGVVHGPSEVPESSGTIVEATTSLPAVLPSYTNSDLPNQMPLPNPPETVRGIYATGWTAGSAEGLGRLVNLVKRTELNTIVVDIKDYSGHVSYAMDIPEVKASGAEDEIRIKDPNAMLKKMHDANIYVIGRITVFQDPILAKAHPEWAFKNKLTGKTWVDSKGLAWMDPAGKPVWDYDVAIAKDAIARGFDEVQFDYVRFASDGTLGNIEYPFWNQKSPRSAVIKKFFAYLRSELGDAKISADLFGLSTINHDDLGIGQVIESAYKYFDYVSPMTYPSHYAPGFIGYKNPAAYPYEVLKYSMDHALVRLKNFALGNTETTPSNATGTLAVGTTTEGSAIPAAEPPEHYAKLRPWLQDFNLGAQYTAPMIRKQIQAVYDSVGSSTEYYDGWLLWNASNVYTEGALLPKTQ